MNLIQHLSRAIINLVLRISIRGVECFHSREELRERADRLNDYPEGSLGKDISDCLQHHGLRQLPYYKDHDLKHVLLGYNMTSVDEIRLQAFMLGNGNRTFSACALFIGGALLLPEVWSVFYRDYQRGKVAYPISSWTVETHGRFQTETLRRFVFRKAGDDPKRSRETGFPKMSIAKASQC